MYRKIYQSYGCLGIGMFLFSGPPVRAVYTFQEGLLKLMWREEAEAAQLFRTFRKRGAVFVVSRRVAFFIQDFIY